MEENISFEDLGLDHATLDAVAAKGFETPSPIQMLAIPRLLEGEANMIAKARTGTGKTAAFGLPLVQKIRSDTGYPQALILTPTRELAMQVCREIESFSTGKYPRLAAVYGGAPMGIQLRDLRQGLEIVVGTPGRVKDHLERGSLKLDKISYFILDEADEMLDMGFIDDIEEIFSEANPESRILLFSATMPPPILKIASKFMGDYEIIEEEARPEEPLLTEQHYWMVREYEKVEALVRLIDLSPDFYGVVFTQTKADADMVSKQLDERGYDAAALHGDIAQNQREKILSRFRNKKTRILVATDVAARGIDIEGLTHVVNYALPYDAATYVHRIGRTGRAGAKGLAYTLVRPEERRKLEFLKSAARKATKGELNEDSIPSVEDVLAVKRTRVFEELKEKLGVIEQEELPITEAVEIQTTDETTGDTLPVDGTDVVEAITIPVEDIPSSKTKKYIVRKDFVSLAEELCEKEDPKELVARLLQLQCGTELDMSRYGSITPMKAFNAGKQTRIYVQLGRKDGFSAKEIAKYFSELLNIQQRMIDRIEVTENFSLLSLPTQAAKDVIERTKKDNSLPHMHLDSKENGGGFGGGRGGRDGGRGRGDGSRRRDGGRGRDRFEGEGRGRGSRSEGSRDRDFGDRDASRGDSGSRCSRSDFGGRDGSRRRGGEDRRRKGSVPGIERRPDEKTGNASLYKKGRGSRG